MQRIKVMQTERKNKRIDNSTGNSLVGTISNQVLSLSILSLILSVLVLSSDSFAQLSGNPDRGFKAGNSYAISDIESINMTGGGNVSMNIPLVSLPKGRGTAPGFSFALTYDSKLWNSEQIWEYDALEQTGSNPISHAYARNLLKASDDGGWKVKTRYQMRVVNRLAEGNREECNQGNAENYSKNSYQWKVEMQTPGGGTMSFRPRGYDDEHNDGFFEISPSGDIVQERYAENIESQPACQVTYPTPITTGVHYYSTDGSSTRLFVPNGGGVNGNWIIYMSDGSVVENKPPDDTSIVQRITDINNNRVKIKNDTHNGVSGVKAIDDLGRFIFYSYSGNKAIQSGANGQELETTLTWKTQWVYKSYRTIPADFLTSIPVSKRTAEINYDFLMLDKITLPTQAGSLTYTFNYHADDINPLGSGGSTTYTDGWGELKSVELPSGADAEYKYDLPENESALTSFKEIISNKITEKELEYSSKYDGQTITTTDKWLYSIDFALSNSTAPSGAVNAQQYFGKSAYLKESSIDWRSGLVHTTINPDGSTTKKIWKRKGKSLSSDDTHAPGQLEDSAVNTYISAEITTITDANGNPALTTKKEYDYDQNSNLLEVREYDFVTAGSSNYTLKRKTVNTYYNQTLSMNSTTEDSNFYGNPNSPILLKLLKSTEVQNGSGNVFTRSEFIYDNSATNPTKGNLTETRLWDSTKQATLQNANSNGFRLDTGNSIATSATYDTYGNVLTTTDAKGVQSQITYGAVNNYSGLYPTQTKSALGLTEERTATATYDFNTGLALTSKDVDNNVENKTEYDDLGRPKKVIAALGTANEIWTQTEYDDTLRRVISKSDLEVKGDGKKVGIQYFDELGRARLARAIENIATEDPYDDEDGIKVQTRYQYDDGENPASSNGVYTLTSNPYRATKSTLATNEDTMGWTLGYSPKDGKYSESETFEGASLPEPFVASNGNTNLTGIVRTDIDANRTLMTDQAGKQRISKTNSLGHLTDVWEVKASDSDTETVSFPTDSSITHAYKTSYSYDTLNNLTTVNQGQQTRTFTYSSLSRLKSANNPESGTISYVYDIAGNLTSKTDARSITTSYVYDNINRVTQRSYNDGITPTVNYTYYNPSIPYSKGQLTKVTSSASTTEYTEFDITGRLKSHKQTTDGEIYTTSYEYNLSGAIIEQTYPSGRVVKNLLDNDGMLSIVQSKKNTNTGFWNYTNSFTYNATGAVESMQLGNGKWESTQFNSRLQPTQIALGTVQSGTDKLKLDYDYSATSNNGNVQSQKITVERSNQSALIFNQSFVYDELNRIKSAEENSDNSTTWKQTYNFDRYGNRTFDVANTTTLGQNFNANISNPTINQSNNRFTTSQGYIYDLNGNLIQDAEGRTFVYDAENKQKEAKNQTNQSLGTYLFDGEGKRVKKVTSTEKTIFVYDGSGQLVAEYSTALSLEPKVQYLTEDNLGTPRIMSDKDGNIISRSDYMPYGEEIIGSGNRTSTDQYQADDIRQGFTGYEKDDETGLDYAQARMYNNRLGRFTATDPIIMKKDRQADPQRINLYVYVRNNPLLFVDKTGMDLLLRAKSKDQAQKRFEIYKKGFHKKNRKKVNLLVGNGDNGYAKGEYAIQINSKAKIKKNDAEFKRAKQLANSSNRAEIIVVKANEEFGIKVWEPDSKDETKQVINTITANLSNQFLGYTLSPMGDSPALNSTGYDPNYYSTSGNIEMYVREDQSNEELSATMHHESVHGTRTDSALTDSNLPYPPGGHNDPSEDKEAKQADSEVKKKFNN